MLTRKNLKHLVCLASVAAGLVFADLAPAVTVNFIGGGAGGGPGYMRTKWSDLGNWQGGALPGTSDTVAFISDTGGWSGVGLESNRVIGGIDFVFSNEFFLDASAQTLTLNNGTLTKRTSGNQGFSSSVILGADAVWSNLCGINYAGGLGMGGPVSGSVAMTLVGARSGQHSGSNLGSTLNVNSLTITPYARLTWSGSANSLPDVMPITINGGKLQYTAQNNVNSTENIGVTSFAGDVALELNKNGTGTATLAATRLTRANGGTVFFRPAGTQVLGTDVFVKVGAGNEPTVTNNMVAPYFLTQAGWADEHGVSNDTNFVTYDGTNGFVPVTYSGATDINTAGSSAIFLATSATTRNLTGNASLHALKTSNYNTGNIDITQTGGPWTLSIGSGGIISRALNDTIYPGIDFGSAPGVIYATGPGHLGISLNGPVAGSGGLAKLGDGYVALNSSANTFTGLVAVNNGTLNIGGSGSANGVGLNRAASVLPLRVCEMATFAMNGHNQTAGGLDGEGTVSGAGTTLTIVRDNSVVSDFAGIIAGAAMNLVKQGNGTQVLSGVNSYTGTTSVTAGSLLVNGTLASAVTVTGGTLGGSGTVTGGVGVSAGAALAPGSSPGILTVGTSGSPSALTMANSSTLIAEINGPTVGTGYDQVYVNGTVSLTTPTLSLSFGYLPVVPTPFFLVANDGTDAISGIFAGVPDGTKLFFSYGGVPFDGVLYYTGNFAMGIPALGNDIVLMVPEPAALGLFLAGAAGLLARRRRA